MKNEKFGATTTYFMKNIITFIALFIFAQIGQSQCPQNTVPGSTINEFDWTTERFTVYGKADNEPPTLREIVSPFYQDGNSEQFNTDHFTTDIPLEFSPSDGWEIIFYNFGNSASGVAEPSFALYNRYNGLLRYFMYITAGESSYQEAFITTYIKELGEVFKNSALLESQNAIHNSLEEFEKKLAITTVSRYSNNQGTWIVSEFLTHYDPCTCVSSMKLVFAPQLQNIQSVSLLAEGTGTTVPIYSNSSDSNDGGIRAAFGKVESDIDNALSAYKKGNEVYGSLNKLVATKTKGKSEAEISSTSTNANILTSIAQIIGGSFTGNPIPVIAGVLTTVTTLVGSKSTKTIASYSSNQSFSITGTIETNTDFQGAVIYVPGSDHSIYPDDQRPIYDNILGIASVIKTPLYNHLTNTIEYVDECPEGGTSIFRETYEYYRLSEDIKYAINTAAGISGIPVNSKAALYFEVIGGGSCENVPIDAQALSLAPGLIRVNSKIWRTPYMNLSCLKEYPVTIRTAISDDCQYNQCTELTIRPYLSLALILESTDGEEIAYLKSYKTSKSEHNYNWATKPENQFLDVPEDLVIDYDDINSSTQSWGNTTVVDPPSKGTVINNNSGGSTIVFLDTDNDPTTPIKYITDAFTVDCGEVSPQTVEYLSGFCNGSDYDPVVALRQSSTPEVESVEIFPVKVMPNPVEDYMTIEYSTAETISFRILNSMGQIVLDGEILDSPIFLGDLNSGMYIIQLFDNQKLIADAKLIKL